MRQTLFNQGEQFLKKYRGLKRWQKVMTVLSCIVVFCTTYALILPAITLEKEAYCGYEEHAGHTKEAGCYKTEQTLVCTQAETEGHQHNDDCYSTSRVLVCGLEESETIPATEETEEIPGHTHSDACYEEITTLTCGKAEEAPHQHGVDCYSYNDVLSCKKTIHSHTADCFHGEEDADGSDKNADVESRAEWEAALKDVELSGKWDEDVLAVAKSQLGYRESTRNYIVNEDGRKLGYSRYGDWYGNSYGDWCAMFVSFCLHYAEVDVEMVPLEAGCQRWINLLSDEEYDLYRDNESYIPKPGDLIFFDWQNYTEEELRHSDHIGLVADVIFEKDSPENVVGTAIPEDAEEKVIRPIRIKTIEGNASDEVRYVTYDADDDHIMGYGVLPENPNYEEENEEEQNVEEAEVITEAEAEETEEAENPEDAEIEETEEAENPEDAEIEETEEAENPEDAETEETEEAENPEEAETEETEEAENPEDAEAEETEEAENEETPQKYIVQSFEGTDYIVTVSYTEEAEIPEEAVLQVSEIDTDSDLYRNYYNQASKILQVENLMDQEGKETRIIDTVYMSSDAEPSEEDSSIDMIEALVFARFFDIRFVVGTEIIEPKVPVDVEITLEEPLEIAESDNVSIVHFADAGTEIISAETGYQEVVINEELEAQREEERSTLGIVKDLFTSKKKEETKKEKQVKVKKEKLDENAVNTFSFKQSSFSITGTVVTANQIPYGEVIMYAESGGRYYAVSKTGEAVPITVNNGAVTCADDSKAADIIWNYERWENNRMYISNGTGSDKVYLNLTGSPAGQFGNVNYITQLTSSTEAGVRYSTFTNGTTSLSGSDGAYSLYYFNYNGQSRFTGSAGGYKATIHFASQISKPTTAVTDYYQIVDKIQANKDYLIVSTEGNYALTATSNTTVGATALKLNPVKGNEGVFNIADVTDTMYWNFPGATGGTSASTSIRSNARNTYLSINSGSVTLDGTYTNTINYDSKSNSWTMYRTVRTANYYIQNSGNGFTGATGGNYVRNMLILEKVATPTVPSDPAAIDSSSGGSDAHVIPKPEYPAYVNPSGAKVEETTLPDADGNVDPGIKGTAYSDKATSQLESRFDGITRDDGKVLADKSVVYGGDDYGAFPSYEDNSFGVELSLLAQEYPVETITQIPTPIDVVFVLDVSGSMQNTTATGETRRQALVNAVNSSMSQIFAQHPANRAGVVVYSSGSWDLLEVDHYSPGNNNQYLTLVDNNVYSAYNLKDSAGRTVTRKTDSTQQQGTYTQSGIARGAAMMERVRDITYTTTVGTGDMQRTVTVERQPVIILLSDGDPTHCTSNYMDVLSGPHYGNGTYPSDTAQNNNGIQGYYTILSANYYKQMVGIHYNVPAKFYTVGMGINATGTADLSGNSATGDHYKRAVLNPSAASIAGLTANGKNQEITATRLRNLLNNTVTDQYISVGSSNSYSQLGRTNTRVPVLKNPYSNYSYADGAYFGNISESELKQIFSTIIAQSLRVKTYGFILVKRSSAQIIDPIGDGMEITSDLVLNYGGINYYPTSYTDYGLATRYHYDYEYVAQDGSGFKADLSQINVIVHRYEDGSQEVEIDVPDNVLPVYMPCEVVGNDWYYEALPVRLIYQVGLTEASKEAIRNMSPGDELNFYTNRYDATNPGIGAQGKIRPQPDNPYYKEDGGYYHDYHNAKDQNTTGTSDNSVNVSSGAETYQGDTVMFLQNLLGNNGKLEFTKEITSVPVMIEKVDMSDNLITSDPAEFKIYGNAELTEEIGTYSTDQGTVTIEDLILGQTYYLKETKAPDGYNAMQNAASFTLTRNPATQEIQIEGINPGDPYISVKDGNVLTIQVKNSDGYTLPNTGGMGTTSYTLGGIALMLMSLLYGFILRRKQERRIY